MKLIKRFGRFYVYWDTLPQYNMAYVVQTSTGEHVESFESADKAISMARTLHAEDKAALK